MQAAKLGHLDIVKFLVEHGADVAAKGLHHDVFLFRTQADPSE
jgi:ankyrin repeat protein